jgi:predicted deacylase
LAAARQSPITIGGITVPAGRKATVELPIVRLPTETQLSLPLAVLRGMRPGPTVWLSGVIHGDELNGLEISRRILSLLRPRQLAGTVLAAPIVNVLGMLTGSRYLPDRRDLNRSFPGRAAGSLAARMAHLVMTEIVDRCDAGIDLHTGSDHRTNLSQVRAQLDDPATRELAEVFAAPISVHSPSRDGSLRQVCAERGIPVLVYEGGEAHRFDEPAIDAGVAGVLRVLAQLGLINPTVVEVPEPAGRTKVVRHTTWVRARRSGILRAAAHLGQEVQRGQHLGLISDAFGGHRAVVRAPFAGMVIGQRLHPLVNRGDALVHLADLNPEARGRAARPPS